MKKKPTQKTSINHIVVLDRGWVYIGKVTDSDDSIIIEDAKCIRRWGTTRGLGELAAEGPKPNTALDPAGRVIAPKRALIHMIECTHSW